MKEGQAQDHAVQQRDPAGGRLHAVDALRAVALLGILSVNIWFFAYPEVLESGLRSTPVESAADQLVRFGSTLLFEGKSYVVFSFLFGLSFVLAWASAHRDGVSETSRALRRSVALILLGVLHGLFLFVGDILLAYGILGLALMGMRNIRTKWALIIAGAVLALIPAFLLVSGAVVMTVEGTETWDASMIPASDPDAAREAYTGSVGSWFAMHLSAYTVTLPSILLGQGPMALAAFLVGLVVGRARLLERIIRHEVPRGRLLAWMIPALLIGGALSTTAAWLLWGAPGSTAPAGATSDGMMGAELLGQGLALLAGPIQATGYVILAMLIFRSRFFSPVTAALAPAGRMSLTNYLSQSVVMAVLFTAIGFGLGGELSAVSVAVVVAVLWLAQLGLSALWMRRFRTGPLEGFVRAFTYRRAPRWR